MYENFDIIIVIIIIITIFPRGGKFCFEIIPQQELAGLVTLVVLVLPLKN